MLLHTLNAASGSSAFKECLAMCSDSDALLLLGDGVYAAIAKAPALQSVLAAGVAVYALSSDLQAAGVSCDENAVTPIDMDGVVQLTERYCRQMAWY